MLHNFWHLECSLVIPRSVESSRNALLIVIHQDLGELEVVFFLLLLTS